MTKEMKRIERIGIVPYRCIAGASVVKKKVMQGGYRARMKHHEKKWHMAVPFESA